MSIFVQRGYAIIIAPGIKEGTFPQQLSKHVNENSLNVDQVVAKCNFYVLKRIFTDFFLTRLLIGGKNSGAT